MRAASAVLVVALGLLATAPPAASAQSCGEEGLDWGFGPTFVPADEFVRHFGARASLDWCTEGHDSSGAGPVSYVFMVGGHYLAVHESVRVPDASRAEATALLSWSVGGFEERADTTVSPDDLLEEGGGFNLGFLELGATGSWESSPDWSEQRIAGGTELRYANNSSSPWAMIFPSIVARWEWVEPTASDAGEAAGVTEADDAHSRWSARGYWNVRGRYLSTALEDWSLRIDASLFRANGLEQVLADAGWESGEYVAVTLRYAPGAPPRRGPIAITSVYAGYAGGQLPTDFEGRDALTGGTSFTIVR